LQLEHGDIDRLTAEQASLQDAIDLYPNGADLVQPLIDTLKDEIAKLGNGLVLQNGAWVAQKDLATVVVPVVGDAEESVTFTTNDGKRFEHAKVSVISTGLSVLTKDGGSSVAFERLPEDISAFPKAVRDKIADWRARNPEAAAPAQYSIGWWQWIKDTSTYLAGKVSGYFSSSSSSPPASSSTNAPPANK
jgi:hypothetical protein